MASIRMPYAGPVVTRDQAKEAGLTRYFTSRPCKYGHIDQRLVSNHRCLTCFYAQRKPAKRSAAMKASDAARRKRAREHLCRYKRAWYRKNKEKIMAANEARRKADPEPQRCRVRARRALRKASSGTHTATDIVEIFRAQRGKCAYCRTALGARYDVDHIVPLIRGGSNNRSNIQLACRRCNRSKSGADPIIFAQRVGLLI